ncbi:MAG: hypothetical protein Q6373_003070 [Candidatus Sigynarchaeota archaeon]
MIHDRTHELATDTTTLLLVGHVNHEQFTLVRGMAAALIDFFRRVS